MRQNLSGLRRSNGMMNMVTTNVVQILALLLMSAMVAVQIVRPTFDVSLRRIEKSMDSPDSSSLSSEFSRAFAFPDLLTPTKDNFRLAREQSYGFFDDIPEQDWKLYQQRVWVHEDHTDQSHRNRRWPGIEPAEYYLNHYDPIFTCPHERRMGGLGDGPKWTCDPHRLPRIAKERAQNAGIQKNCLIYSIGCAGKYQWEEALAKSLMEPGQDNKQTACEIHVFDFSKNYTVEGHKERLNIHFHQWGLKSSYDDSMTKQLRPQQRNMLYTLEETMKKLGHEHHIIDIFKIDCEFCEWFTFKDWLDPTKADIRQLLMETHNLPRPEEEPNKNKGGAWFPTRTNVTPADFFDDIEAAGFVMFSKEPNIHPQAKVCCDDIHCYVLRWPCISYKEYCCVSIMIGKRDRVCLYQIES